MPAPPSANDNSHALKRQPLRMTEGWKVQYNNALYEIDPDPALVREEDRWWVFKEDMLVLVHEDRKRLLDLGFYPEGDLANGNYGLVVHEGGFQGPLLHEFATKDRAALVEEIERLMEAVTNGRF